MECISSVSLPFSTDQILAILYKLSLEELLQMRDLSKLKSQNLASYVKIFVLLNWKASITAANQIQFMNMLELIARFATDTTTHAEEAVDEVSLDAYAKLSMFRRVLNGRLTQADVQATQLEIPTGCFFYGLWLGANLLGVAKDSLKISESIKAIVFSYQRFLAKESYHTILASFLPRFLRVSDLAKSVFALIPNETSESLEAFCKSKFVEESNQKVDQMQLVFVELNKSWSKRSAESFRQQSEAKESALQDRFLRFEGGKDNRALFRETSSRSLHSNKILKAQQEREHRLNLSRLDQLILRIRCNESSAWFRESVNR